MPDDARAAIERFLAQARRPALLEPGEELLLLTPENYALELRGPRLTLQAWDRTRNLVRRVTGVGEQTPGRIELSIERFARREGKLFLLDLARPAGSEMGKRSGRFVFRERFRRFLRRQFPEWNLAELSAEADLEHSLSPVYPRALLAGGKHAWAAIAAPPGSEVAGVLAFGLIWLDYLRRREQRRVVEGLAIYVPEGHPRRTALRLRWLHPGAARFELFAYSEEDFVTRADPADIGNLDTKLEPCHAPGGAPEICARVAAMDGVECVWQHDGSARLRARGLEFGEVRGGALRFGLRQRVALGPHNEEELFTLAGELAAARHPAAAREHPLYRQSPEAWLEAQCRACPRAVDATLTPAPVYGQVPAFAGGERGVMDLLAADYTGRLAVMEIKATADLQLPLQALDYWMRVNWHAARHDFTACGYFPGVALRADPPRLLLVSPALEFHPTTEALLGYFSPEVDVERIGLGVEWRKSLEVVFRLRAADHPT